MKLSILALLPLALIMGRSDRSEKRFEDLTVPAGIKTKLHPDFVKVLENAESYEILSIDPSMNLGSKDPKYWGWGCTLIGKTTISDKAVRRRVADAIYRSVDRGTQSDWCFDPRHAIRVSIARRTVDFVICFQCHSMHIQWGDVTYGGYPISDAAKTVLNEILIGAGIPLAKE